MIGNIVTLWFALAAAFLSHGAAAPGLSHSGQPDDQTIDRRAAARTRAERARIDRSRASPVFPRPQDSVAVLPSHATRLHLQANAALIRIGEIVRFTVTAEGPTGSDLDIDYGDGGKGVIAGGQTGAEHRFARAGTFTVTVRQHPVFHTMTVAVPPVFPDSIVLRVDSVALDAIPGTADVGQTVAFHSLFNAAGLNVQYRYNFGDNTPATGWEMSPQASHVYQAPGRYFAYVEIGTPGDLSVQPFTRSSVREVRIAERKLLLTSLVLIASSMHAGVNQELTFTAVPQPDIPGLQYRFTFGDGTESGWTQQRTVSHTYSRAGTFMASVEASGAGSPRVSEAIALTIASAPPPGIPGWIYVIAIVFIAGAGYAATKQFLKPRVEFETLPGHNEGRVDDQPCLEVQVEVTLKPHLHAAESEVQVREGKLIRKEGR